jgi:hypothetical protein
MRKHIRRDIPVAASGAAVGILIASLLCVVGCASDEPEVEIPPAPGPKGVTYEVARGADAKWTHEVTDFRDTHGRVCTVVYVSQSPGVDCDYPPSVEAALAVEW